MKIIPLEKLILVTEFPKLKVIEQLNSIVSPRQNLIFTNKNIDKEKKFEGSFFGDNFNITRIINYKNSFNPEIIGKISDRLNIVEIEIELKPTLIVQIFMLLWLFGVSFAFIAILIGAIIGEGPIYICIFPLIMFFMAFRIFNYGFSTESEKAKKDLIEVLHAKIKN